MLIIKTPNISKASVRNKAPEDTVVGRSLFQHKMGFCSDQRFTVSCHPYWVNDPGTRVGITILVHFGLNTHSSHSEIPVTVNVTQADHCSLTQMKECTQTEENHTSFSSRYGKCTFCIYLNSRLCYISCYPTGLQSVPYHFQIRFGNTAFENWIFPFLFFMHGHDINSIIKLICFAWGK